MSAVTGVSVAAPRADVPLRVGPQIVPGTVLVDWGLAVLGMALGAWIRVAGLYRQSLWVDEMSSYGLALQPLRRIIPNILAVDGHPPLYIFLVHVAHFTFGLGTIDSVRVPSLVAGVATIGIVYALARSLAGRVAAVVATALTVIAPLLVWYSREGRMYGVTWFFVMLSFLLLVLAVRADLLPGPPRQGAGALKRRIWLPLYASSIGLALYADISSVMALVPQGALVAWSVWRQRDEMRALWLRIAAGYAAGWLLFVPWLLVLPRQLPLLRGTFTGYPPTLATAWRLVLNLTNLEPTYAYIFKLDLPAVAAAVALVAYAAAIIAAILLGRNNPLFRAVVLSLTLGPALMCAFFVLLGSPGVFLPRAMGLASFGLILAPAAAAELAWRSWRLRQPVAIAASASVLVVAASTLVALVDVEAHGYNSQNWRPVAATISAHAQPGDVVIYYPLGLKIMVDAYLPADSPWKRDGVGIWQAPDNVAGPYFAKWALDRPHVWFVFYAAAGIDAPTHDAWFRADGYRRVLGDPTAGYGLLEYVPAS